MRHAQSTYNHAIRSPLTWLKPTFYFRGFDPGPKFIDARLSDVGLKQVESMRNKLIDLENSDQIFQKCDLIITSPLSRAIQTCLGVMKNNLNTKIIAHPGIKEVARSSCDIGRDVNE